jgi:hypothetical protein
VPGTSRPPVRASPSDPSSTGPFDPPPGRPHK